MERQAVLTILHYNKKMYNENDTNENHNRIETFVVLRMKFDWQSMCGKPWV